MKVSEQWRYQIHSTIAPIMLEVTSIHSHSKMHQFIASLYFIIKCNTSIIIPKRSKMFWQKSKECKSFVYQTNLNIDTQIYCTVHKILYV